MSSPPEIHDAVPSFQFDRISLTTPISIIGGAHFSKILMDRGPLYIQTPKCVSKAGIVGSGRKMYTDLIFTNENEEIIQWMEALETTVRRKIYENRGKWFASEMSEDDIEGCFSPMVKLFRSGKQYCVRVNINSKPDAKPLKIYDEDEMTVEAAQITEKTTMIAILEIQGVRCTSKSFCVDVEMKQLMVMKPSDLFDSCIILKGRTPPPVEKHLAKIEEPIVLTIREDDGGKGETRRPDTNLGQEEEPSSNQIFQSAVSGDTVLRKSGTDILGQDPIIIADNDEVVTQGNGEVVTQDNDEVVTQDNDEVVTQDNDEVVTYNNDEVVTQGNGEAVTQYNGSSVVNNEFIEVIDSDVDYLGLSNADDILEVNLDVNEIDAADTFQLKDKKEVYYEMYREALQKAKAAKAVALTEFMEARRIKNLYMLKDLNDSDDESDLDDLDDLSDDDE
jgi:hypothetical protein